MTQMWTPDGVKAALIEAFMVDRLTGGRVGPRQYGSGMPAYFSDDVDMYVLELQDLADPEHGGTRGEHFRKMQMQRRAEMERQRRITSQQISRMERILLGVGREPSWLHGLLAEERHNRITLEAFSVQSAIYALRGKELKENRLCKRMKWAYSTYRDRRDVGANIITWKLNQIGIECWVPGMGRPDTDPRDVPLTVVLMEFLKGGPKTKSAFVAFCYDHRVIPEKDLRNNAVAAAFAKLVAAGRIRKRPDLAYERV